VARTQDERSLTLTPIAFEILLTLAKEPQHGYGIKLDIQERTEGELSLGSGTLYQAIQRLERGDMIGPFRGPEPAHDARRGRYYELRPRGRVALEAELQRLNRVIEYARAQNLLTDPNPTP
jgi:DNA-binding PadR family transcriptional regulator